MARRRSKAKRREIARHIHWKRIRQPGYAEILKEESDLKRQVSEAIYRRRGQNGRKRRALLTDTIFSSLAYRASETIESSASFLASHIWGVVIALGVLILLFDWLKVALFVTLLLGCCHAILKWSQVVRLRQEIKHKDAILALNADSNNYEKKIREALEEQLMSMCDEFVGYPPDWSERRLRVFRRDAYTCQTCYRKLTSDKLHAHHIVEVAYGGTCHMHNLTTLCARCHGKEHGGQP